MVILLSLCKTSVVVGDSPDFKKKVSIVNFSKFTAKYDLFINLAVVNCYVMAGQNSNSFHKLLTA